MRCDYYTEKSLVIKYISVKGRICEIETDKIRQRGYLSILYFDYETEEEKYKKYIQELEKTIKKYIYIKPIYENKSWLRPRYSNKYETLKKRFPEIRDFIKIYRKSDAWINI